MDSNSVIIGAIIVAMCIVPFVVINRYIRIKERKVLKSFMDNAHQQNCDVSHHEICGDFIIGIDEQQKSIFFSKKLKDKVVEQYIKLTEMKSCRVQSSARTVGNQSVIDRLVLSFIPIDKNMKEIGLEFFNSDISMQLNTELEAVERWSDIINGNLKN